ncbi:hypothetical protein G3N58_06865 [Paraburkholderia sp. Ac-20342]|nr:hypothetical protein [Paraburkholderia sp. Ac-20342]NIF56628.1 hypothetical protein [Burkholderia sp. Ax-1724]NIF77956.1 hypothetical protein [Paraburkholderia sp. Cy-641]
MLASNTSVIPITEIGAHLGEQARFRLVDTHWWNPPHLVPLTEVVCTRCSDPSRSPSPGRTCRRSAKSGRHTRSPRQLP